MSQRTLYDLFGIPEERAEAIAKLVRKLFAESPSSEEWVESLIEQFEIGPEDREIFACGWFAGRYAGVSEVFTIVQKELDRTTGDYPPTTGYV